MDKRLVSWLLLVACNLMWSLQFTCIKLVQDQVGPYFTVWGPMLLATLLLIPFVFNRKKMKAFTWKDVSTFIPLTLLGAFPAQLLMTIGTQYSTASNSAIISLALPIATLIFAVVLLKEKLNLRSTSSFALAILGVIFCSLQAFGTFSFEGSYVIGNLLVFMSVASNAYYNIGCKRVSEHFSAIEMVFFTYLVMVVALSPFLFFWESDVFVRFSSFSTQTWVGLALLTFFHNFLSMVLFFKALKNLSAIQTGLSNYMITLFGLPIAAVWLGEKLNMLSIVGGVLIILSTVLAASKKAT